MKGLQCSFLNLFCSKVWLGFKAEKKVALKQLKKIKSSVECTFVNAQKELNIFDDLKKLFLKNESTTNNESNYYANLI